MAHSDQITRITAAPGKGDVMVRATYFEDSGNIFITCVQMPGSFRWQEPSAELMRDMVDSLADSNGRTRTGRRVPMGGWTYFYRTN